VLVPAGGSCARPGRRPLCSSRPQALVLVPATSELCPACRRVRGGGVASARVPLSSVVAGNGGGLASVVETSCLSRLEISCCPERGHLLIPQPPAPDRKPPRSPAADRPPTPTKGAAYRSQAPARPRRKHAFHRPGHRRIPAADRPLFPPGTHPFPATLHKTNSPVLSVPHATVDLGASGRLRISAVGWQLLDFLLEFVHSC
jgi:hypothetical protein